MARLLGPQLRPRLRDARRSCTINRTVVASSSDFERLLKSKRFDLASPSGDVAGTLIAEKLVQPVDIARVPAWRQLTPSLRSPAFNTVSGKHYGVTVLWTPNELLYHRQRAKPAPATWRAVYDDRFKGRISIPDNPMQIADAALYLRDTVPGLRIRDPYELTKPQFDAAVALLRRQRPLVRRYWEYATEQIQDFRTGAAVVGSAWPYQGQVLLAANVPIREFVPREGSTAWADSWMLAAKAAHPNCAYKWLQYVLDGARPGDGGARAPRVAHESPRLQAARGDRGRALRDLPRCRAALVHEAARLLEDARRQLRR